MVVFGDSGTIISVSVIASARALLLFIICGFTLITFRNILKLFLQILL